MNRLMPHTGSANSRKHIIDVIFPIAVFFVFAASSLAVLMLASRIYDDTSTSASENYSSRAAFAYVSEKLRQHDSGGGISCGDMEGSDCLILKENESDTVTYIYMYDGSLRELRVRSDVRVSPESGLDITPVKGFSVSSEDSLLFINITADDGTEYSLVSSERSTE